MALCVRVPQLIVVYFLTGFQRMQKFGVFGSGQFAVKGGALRMETACALYISLLSALTTLGKRRDCGWEVCPRRFQLFRLICRNL